MLELRAIIDPRRDLLVTQNNPARRMDYIITLNQQLKVDGFDNRIRLVIRYVPDAHILDKAAIGPYIEMIENTPWANLESLARTLLDDFANELVARWVEVAVAENSPDPELGTFGYGITMEDRQPTWSNPELLNRLRPTL